MLHNYIKKPKYFLKKNFYFPCKSSLIMSHSVLLSDGLQVVPLENILAKQ